VVRLGRFPPNLAWSWEGSMSSCILSSSSSLRDCIFSTTSLLNNAIKWVRKGELKG